MRLEEPGAQNPDEGRPGRLGRRLIDDIFLGRLNDDPHDGCTQNSIAPWSCPALKDSRLRPAFASLQHDLIFLPAQNSTSPDGTLLMSCMCRACRYHFVFRISPGACEEDPRHHFILQLFEEFEPEDVETNDEAKLYPLRCRASYQCSVCAQSIVLEVSAPRLKPEWILLITDEQRIRSAIKAAREEDPVRYQGVTEEQATRYATTPLQTLNHYLGDVLNDREEKQKRISFRNKTFMSQFGGSCDHIFRYLLFDVIKDETLDESYWVPPRLGWVEGRTSTPLRSPRAFIDDVKSEIQSLLEDNPPGDPVVELVTPPPRIYLEEALKVDRKGANTRKVASEEGPELRILGAPADSDEATLEWAYLRQVATDPGRKEVYLSALGGLASRRGHFELQMFCIEQQGPQGQQETQHPTAASAGADAVEEAYKHFNFQRNAPEADSYFINVYRTFRAQAPAQKHQHRAKLLQVGRDRNSQLIFDEIYKTPMELAEACAYLSVSSDWPMEHIAAVAQSAVSESDINLTIMALEAISIAVDDPSRPQFEAVLAEIRALASQQSVAAALHASDNGGQTDGAAVDMSLPVGLDNLRNTCYLNSILQYFYSVNAVRDLVTKLEQPDLQPTDQYVRELLQSADVSDLEPGRAFVGSEFSRELGGLFSSLETAPGSCVKPRQRLANAALLRPERIRAKTEVKSEESATVSGPPNKDAPPLPPRTGESSEPKVTVDPVQESSETASVVSSQTLVEKPEDDQFVVISHDTVSKTGSAAMEVDDPDALLADPPKEASKEPEAKSSKLTVEELAAELDKPNVGSDQMDVDEVMGNAIDHLRAAYKVARTARPDLGPDPIEQAFFSTFIDNRKKLDEETWNRSTRSDRWVTAYPAKSGQRDLYDALAVSFDLERLPGDLLSFTTIERPAPYFHICIQRSDGVSKNSNPIKIPETLYLDRFMHTGDQESDLFKTKKHAWDVKNRLMEVEPVVEAPPENTQSHNMIGPAPKPKAETPSATKEVDGFMVIEHSGLPNHDLDTTMSGEIGDDQWGTVDSAIHSMYANHPGLKSELPDTPLEKPVAPTEESTKVLAKATLQEYWSAFNATEDDDRVNLKAQKDAEFLDMRNVAYRLHAVVCHAGATARAGHYWVWIHDFEQDVWRKYNDTRVSVHKAEDVFEELNNKGEPYYLAYVRDSEMDQLVSIPRRNPSLVASANDVEMPDVNQELYVKVEDAADTEPPPYDIL